MQVGGCSRPVSSGLSSGGTDNIFWLMLTVTCGYLRMDILHDYRCFIRQ